MPRVVPVLLCLINVGYVIVIATIAETMWHLSHFPPNRTSGP